MKSVMDLFFSYFFVITSVIIGGYGLSMFYGGEYLNFLFLLIATIYLFGIGCMGLNRIKKYSSDKCNYEFYETSQ